MNDLTKIFNGVAVRNRRSETGVLLISLTDLANAGGKKVQDWTRLKSTEAYLSEYSDVTGIPATHLIQKSQGGTPKEQGTWADAKIAIQFAQWCSARFSIQVSLWVEELMSRGEVHLSNSVDVATGELKPLDQQLVEMQERIEGLVEALESEGIERINTSYQLEREKKLHSQTIKERDHWMGQYDRLKAKMKGLI